MPAVTNANIITFIVSDPRSVGFSAIRTAHPGLDGPLVDAASNASGVGSGVVPSDPISKTDLYGLIDPGNLKELSDVAHYARFFEQKAKEKNPQVRMAIDEADLILYLVDVGDGIVPQDWEIAQMLRTSKKPLLLVATM